LNLIIFLPKRIYEIWDIFLNAFMSA